MKTLVAKKESEGIRIDRFLAEALDIPRARIQKSLKSGDITRNEEPVKAHALIEEGDVFSFPEALVNPPKIHRNAPPPLEILYEDDDIIILNKPAGLIVHEAGPESADATLVDALLLHNPSIATVGEDDKRPGIVHRLDKDVSGVMVAAKTQAAYDHLKKQFQERSVTKEYLALVYGQLPKDHDEIRLKISRSKNLGRMVAKSVEEEDGKESLTVYDVLERYKTATYIKVRIETGRTHQIRVHMKAIDHPLVGDKLYMKKRMKNIRPIEMNRIFLHATRLTVTLMNGEDKTVEVPLPKELKSVLKELPKE